MGSTGPRYRASDWHWQLQIDLTGDSGPTVAMAIVANSGGALSIPQQLSMLLDWQRAGFGQDKESRQSSRAMRLCGLGARCKWSLKAGRRRAALGAAVCRAARSAKPLTPISVETGANSGEQPLGLDGFAIGP